MITFSGFYDNVLGFLRKPNRRSASTSSKGPIRQAQCHPLPTPLRRNMVTFSLGNAASRPVVSVGLRYRHLDQSEAYSETRMSLEGGRYVATITAEVLDSPFPLQYFFVIRDSSGSWGDADVEREGFRTGVVVLGIALEPDHFSRTQTMRSRHQSSNEPSGPAATCGGGDLPGCAAATFSTSSSPIPGRVGGST